MSTIHSRSVQRIEAATYDQTLRTGSSVSDSSKSKTAAKDSLYKERTEAPEKRQKLDLGKLDEKVKESLYEELKKHNDSFAYTGKYLRFRYDEEAATSYVEVIDAASQEVVVSLPPEFLIDLSVKMKKIIGMYIDKKL